MALTAPGICDFGWKARDFALRGTDGKMYGLADVRGDKGTLVVFICNHCPYVKAVIGRLGVDRLVLMPRIEYSLEDVEEFVRAHAPARLGAAPLAA